MTGVAPLKRNAGAVFSLKYHVVWCPKYRRKVLVGAVAERLKGLLAEKAAELGAVVHALEVMPDHVHLFVESDPTCSPSHLAHQFKGFTSHVLRQIYRKYGKTADKGLIVEAMVRNYLALPGGLDVAIVHLVSWSSGYLVIDSCWAEKN